MARRETGRTRPYNYQLLINHWLGAGLLILRWRDEKLAEPPDNYQLLINHWLGAGLLILWWRDEKLAEPAPTIINY